MLISVFSRDKSRERGFEDLATDVCRGVDCRERMCFKVFRFLLTQIVDFDDDEVVEDVAFRELEGSWLVLAIQNRVYSIRGGGVLCISRYDALEVST